MKYIVKKLATMIVTLLVVSFLVFACFTIIPGDAATSMLGTQVTESKLIALREEMGLSDPFLLRYVNYLTGVFRGDFGISYSYHTSVTEMIADKIPITLTLTIMSFLMILVVSIPLGIYTAKHRESPVDRIITMLNQIIMSIPPFFSGIIITFLFGILLKWFVPGGFVSYTKDWGAFLLYMIFPAIAVALPKIAMTVKLLRSSVLEEVDKEYVRTAYSHGLSTTKVLYQHVLKNAMIPVVTFLGMVLTDMIAGSIIIEQVFNIPGLGRILLTSISNRDYPVVEGIILCIAAMVLVTNFLVDVIYRVIDPRIDV